MLHLSVHIFVYDGIVYLQSMSIPHSWPHRFAVHTGVNASLSSRYITTTSADFHVRTVHLDNYQRFFTN